jgi:hypothetical protein
MPRYYYLPVVGLFAVSCGLLLHGAGPLRVQYVRFVPAPQLDGVPSTFLKFGLSNETANDLTNIAVKVSILREFSDSDDGGRLAGPYTLMGQNLVLHPGQTLDFELRLRNLSSHCGCVARVRVLSADSEPSNGADPADVPASSPKGPEPSPTNLSRAVSL